MAPAPPRVCQGAWDQPLPPEGGGRAHFVPVILSFSSLGVVLSCPLMCPLQGRWPCPCVPSVCPPCPRSVPSSVLCLHSSLPWGRHWPLGGAGFALQDQDEHLKPWLGAMWLCPELFWLCSTFLGHSWVATSLLSLFCASSARLPGEVPSQAQDAAVLKTQPRGCKEQKNVGTAPQICCPGMRAAQGMDPAGSGL